MALQAEFTSNFHATLFKDVREVKLKKSRRKRQCFACLGFIAKDEKYINHQFRYDFNISTVSFHAECYCRIDENRKVSDLEKATAALL